MTEPAKRPIGSGGDEGGDSREALERAVETLRSGVDSESCFRLLFESYYHPLRRFFARKGFARDDALDLTQETLIGIYKGVRDFRQEARFETWLYRVATTTYLKRIRSGSAAKRSGIEISIDDMISSAHEPPAPSADQLAGMMHDEKRQKMREAIEVLPEKMRKCLTLRLYHDLDYREIATVMKLNINTVKAHLFQAKKRLRENLKAYSLEVLDP